MDDQHPVTTCHACHADLGQADVNTDQGVALCPACGHLCPFDAEAAEAAAQADALVRERLESLAAGALARPPRGCRLVDHGSRWRVVASMRNWSLLVVGTLATVFPAVTVGVALGGNADPMFLLAFGTGSIGIVAAAVLMLFGRVEVRVDGGQGRVFTGVGPLGHARTFEVSKVRDVRFVKSSVSNNGKPVPDIGLIGTGVAFGSFGLSNDRKRAFFVAELRRRLLD